MGRCHTQPVMQSHGFTWFWNYYIKFYEKLTLSNFLLIMCPTVTAGSTICTYRTIVTCSVSVLKFTYNLLCVLRRIHRGCFPMIDNVIKNGFSCCSSCTFISQFHSLLLWNSQVLNHNSSNQFLNLKKSTDFRHGI